MAGLNGTPRNGWEGANASEGSVPDSSTGDDVVGTDRDLSRDWSGLLPDVRPHEDPELDHVRLEAEIAAARARVAIAKHRSAEVSAALRAEILASQEQLAEMERAHAVEIAEIQAQARAESAELMATARLEAARIIAGSADGDDATEARHGH